MANNMATVAEYIVLWEKDKRVSDWLLMSSIWPTVFVAALYLVLVYSFLPAYMKNRKPYHLTTTIRIYNLLQIATCAWIIYQMATSGWVQGEYNIRCQPIDYSNNPQAVRLLKAFHWTYFLKMVELVETVFFILRKKFNQVTNLHVYHHVSTMMFAWLACKFMGGGSFSIPVMLNSFIHILMYTYYYLASFGPAWQKRLAPWKPRLTIAQMAQFTLLLIQGIMMVMTSCDTPHTFIMLYIPNIIFIYKMFYDFYQQSYSHKKKTTK